MCKSAEQAAGPLSAEFALRQAIHRFHERLFESDDIVSHAENAGLQGGMAAAVCLLRAADAGGLSEMLAEFRHVRLMLGRAADWDANTGACVTRLEAAYNAALYEGEIRAADLCVVRHRRTGLVLAARFNELADDGGIAHMRWMGRNHQDTKSRAWCEVVAAAWNALAEDNAAVVEAVGK